MLTMDIFVGCGNRSDVGIVSSTLFSFTSQELDPHAIRSFRKLMYKCKYVFILIQSICFDLLVGT
jgi:hypothetical protein